jgi:hypothetical protein
MNYKLNELKMPLNSHKKFTNAQHCVQNSENKCIDN